MVNPSDDTIMEERKELMVPPTGGDPILRVARFLKSSVTSIDGPVIDIPKDCLSPACVNAKPKNWPLKVLFKGWKTPQKEWKSWVHRMQALHESTWRAAGIHDTIMSSTCTIRRNQNLVLWFAEMWCPETNTFVFPWAESTVTLEDMMILGGYSVLGKSILYDSVSDNREMENIRKKLVEARRELARSKAQKAEHNPWLARFMDSGSEIEHEAFLALWLSRFVFPLKNSYREIKNDVFPIAIRLARGTKIALAPAVLSSIYRDLTLLKDNIVDANKLRSNARAGDNVLKLTVLAPFQLLQVWVWERFPTLRPSPNSVENGKQRMARWDNVIPTIIQNVRLSIESASEQFQWRPYATASKNSLSLPCKFYKQNKGLLSVGSVFDEDLESFVRCLRVSELVGLDSIEKYLPHRVAMQFGMDQDLPGHVARVNANPEIAWENYTRPIRDAKLYFPSRLFESGVTSRYLKWWKKLMFGEKSSSKAAERKYSECLSAKKTDLYIPPPPGFPPKRSVVEVSDSSDEDELTPAKTKRRGTVDEDKQTIAELVRNARKGNRKRSPVVQLQSSLSSIDDNRTVEELRPMVKPVEGAVEGSEIGAGNFKPSVGAELRSPRSSNADNGNVKKSQMLMGSGKSERSSSEGRDRARIQNMASINGYKGESSNVYADKMPGLQKSTVKSEPMMDGSESTGSLAELERRGLALEARIDKLKRVVALIKQQRQAT